MDVVEKQHTNSDDHNSKSRAIAFIAFSSLLDKFVVNAKDAYDVLASEIAQVCHAVKRNISYNSLDCT